MFPIPYEVFALYFKTNMHLRRLSVQGFVHSEQTSTPCTFFKRWFQGLFIKLCIIYTMLAIPIFNNKISLPLSQSNKQKVCDLKSLMIKNIQQDVPMNSTAVVECLHLKALTPSPSVSRPSVSNCYL